MLSTASSSAAASTTDANVVTSEVRIFSASIDVSADDDAVVSATLTRDAALVRMDDIATTSSEEISSTSIESIAPSIALAIFAAAGGKT